MKRIAVLMLALFAASASAQSYPTKPIRIVVPYAAGGTSDILARQIGPELNKAWGQPVVVENKPGANGNVGADFVAKSAPDGYTLLLTDLGGLVISASVYPKLPFNPSKDFTPVVMVSYSPHVLAVHPEVKAKDVKELVAMAKAYPGKLNFAMSGIGGAPHLAGIEFAQRMGIDWAYIPYKGGADAITGVVGGQAHVLFNGMLATLPPVKAGKLKALGCAFKGDAIGQSMLQTPTGHEGLTWEGQDNLYDVPRWVGSGGTANTRVKDEKTWNTFWGDTDKGGSKRLIVFLGRPRTDAFSHGVRGEDFEFDPKSAVYSYRRKTGIDPLTVGPGHGFVRYRESFEYRTWERGGDEAEAYLLLPVESWDSWRSEAGNLNRLRPRTGLGR